MQFILSENIYRNTRGLSGRRGGTLTAALLSQTTAILGGGE